MDIAQTIMLAFLIEAVWETLKLTWQEEKISLNRIGVLFLSLLATFIYQIDLLHVMNVTHEFNYFGVFLSGILISRGGNIVHDVVEFITGRKERGK